MVDDCLVLNKTDGLIHRYRHVYGGFFRDMGLYISNGNRLALNDVNGEIDEVRPNRWNNSWEKVRVFSPDGKTVDVRKDTGLVEETMLDFFRNVVRKADFVPLV